MASLKTLPASKTALLSATTDAIQAMKALSSGKREWTRLMDQAVRKAMERHGHTGRPWGYGCNGELRKADLATVLKEANEQIASAGDVTVTKKQMIDRWESVLCDEARECAGVRNLKRGDYEDLAKAIEAAQAVPTRESSSSQNGTSKATGCGWDWSKVMEAFNQSRVSEGKPRLTKLKLRNFYYTCKDAMKKSNPNEESLPSWPLIKFCRESRGLGGEGRKKSVDNSGGQKGDKGPSENPIRPPTPKPQADTSAEQVIPASMQRSGSSTIHRPTPRRATKPGVAATPLATITNLPQRPGSSFTAATPNSAGSFSFGKGLEGITPLPFDSGRKRPGSPGRCPDTAFVGRGGMEHWSDLRTTKASKTAQHVEEENTPAKFPTPLSFTPFAGYVAAAAGQGTGGGLHASTSMGDTQMDFYLNMVMSAAEFLKTVDAERLPHAIRENVAMAVSQFQARAPSLSCSKSDDFSSPSG